MRRVSLDPSSATVLPDTPPLWRTKLAWLSLASTLLVLGGCEGCNPIGVDGDGGPSTVTDAGGNGVVEEDGGRPVDDAGSNSGDDDAGNNGDDDAGSNSGDDDAGNSGGDDDAGNSGGDDDAGNSGGDDDAGTTNDDAGNSGDDDAGNSGGDDDAGSNDAGTPGANDAGVDPTDGGPSVDAGVSPGGCTVVGAPCDDGFFCFVGETCQPDGSCGGGSLRDCSDAAPDGQCSFGTCNELTDTCIAVAQNTGDACDDGLYCTVNERCQSDGTCAQGVGRSCGYLVDETQCESAACNESTDACELTFTNQMGACDDGEFCTDAVCTDGVCAGPSTGDVCGAANELCCAGGTVCVNDDCVVPGGACTTTDDCDIDEICDPVLQLCIDRALVEVCEYIPPVGVLNPVIGCRWAPPAGSVTPGRDNVVMNPVVADVTEDGFPEIMFVAWDRADGNCCDEPATLYVTSGTCNSEDGTLSTIASVRAPNPGGGFYDLDESGGLSVADLDGDGVPEIVGMLLTQGTIAFKRAAADGSDWSVYWANGLFPDRGVHTNGGTQPSVADLDGDGLPEVIIGNVALNGQTGALLWDGQDSTPPPGAGRSGIGNNAFLGPVSHVADIDLDGDPEVIAGNSVYGPDGTIEWTYDFTTTGSNCTQGLVCDGFTATGNFDDDDYGEVVIVRQGEVFIISHDGQLETMADPNNAGSTLNMQADLPPLGVNNRNESGPPTVADFDGDGRAEIGTASAQFYVVVDFDCVGAGSSPGCDRSVQDPSGTLEEYVLWKTPNNDASSRATGSSVFDFEGDGAAEVVYADERDFMILVGKTGEVLYRDTTHGSNTRLEMPVIADVDNDGNAEVIIPENENQGGTAGVEIWEDADANWVRTRKIWNQHSYHVTNIHDDGTVPLYEEPNWLNPRLNNFRQNVQPSGVFDAADVFVESISATCDASGDVVVTACIGNDGAISLPPGVPNTGKLILDDNSEVDLGTAITADPLVPGSCVNVEFRVPIPAGIAGEQPFSVEVTADDDGGENGAYNECNEDNNSLRVDGFSC